MAAAIVLLVAVFAAAPVVLSHDVYSYVDYGRLGALHGLDPYSHPPSAVPSDQVFSQVEWRQATSVYGPLFTLFTYALAALPVWAAVAALKALAAASVLGLAAVVARLAALRGVAPARAAAFVALNPLVLVHVVGGGHNDGIATLVAVLAAASVLSAREATGGAAFVAAVGIKLTAGVAAPFALAGAGRRRRALLGGALAAVALVLVANLAFGWSWLDALSGTGAQQGHTSHMSVPATFARLTGAGLWTVRVVAIALYGALFAGLLAWAWRGGDWIRAAGWATAGLLLASAWLLPWYLVWALPFAALSRDRGLQALLLAITAFQLGARIPL